MAEAKRRSPALAALASFLLPGLGQLYNGQTILFAVWLIGYFLAAIFYTLRLLGVILSDNPAAEMTSVFGPLALMGLIWLGSVVHAIFGALNQPDYQLQSYNRGLVYLGCVLVAYVLLPAVISIPLVGFAMKQQGITTPQQVSAARAKLGRLGLGGVAARAGRERSVDLKIDIPNPDSMAALATTVFHVTLVGGQDGGIYDATSNQVICTHRSSTGQPSWAGLYANPADTSGLTAVQFRVPIDEGETSDFQLSINRGSGAEGRSYLVDGRRPWGENGKGRAQIERRNGSAVIRMDASTAEGVRVEAVVQCKAITEE